MPFDPEWGLEETREYQTAPKRDPPDGEGLLHDEDFENDEQGKKVIWDSQDDYEGAEYEQEGMEVDLLVLPKPNQRQEDPPPPPLAGSDATPKGSKKLPSLRPTPRPSQIAVVLNSSPRRTPFSTVPDDLSDDPLGMITSDLIPKPHAKRSVQISPPKAPLVVPTETPTMTLPKKKRGRPLGWRPGSGPYTNLTGGSTAPRPKPPKKPADEKRKVGRPGRPPAPTGRQVYLAQNPHFLVFKCEWQGCQAELHNAETLRKHILIVHGRPPPPDSDVESTSPRANSSSSALYAEKPSRVVICRWAKCRSSATAPPITFDVSTFPDHAEQSHVLPILWQLGDGPQNTSALSTPIAPLTGNKLPSYLFDETNTIQVTPDVRDQQTENDEDRKKRQAKINRILQQRDDNAPPEPEYTDEQLADIAKYLDEKKKRQKMFRDYAEKYAVAESLKSSAAAAAAAADGARAKRIKVERGGGVVKGVRV